MGLAARAAFDNAVRTFLARAPRPGQAVHALPNLEAAVQKHAEGAQKGLVFYLQHLSGDVPGDEHFEHLAPYATRLEDRFREKVREPLLGGLWDARAAEKRQRGPPGSGRPWGFWQLRAAAQRLATAVDKNPKAVIATLSHDHTAPPGNIGVTAHAIVEEYAFGAHPKECKELRFTPRTGRKLQGEVVYVLPPRIPVPLGVVKQMDKYQRREHWVGLRR